MNASKTRPAAALEMSASAAILSINCDLFTLFIPSFIIHIAPALPARCERAASYIKPVELKQRYSSQSLIQQPTKLAAQKKAGKHHFACQLRFLAVYVANHYFAVATCMP
ncbi:hypothetical protein [Pantoea sp. CTOTU46764]|uniref:hypothetical protein n=1 Tax=Pantoea sp. CTOTU46764 TaxID=2953854 RepID=UPI00289B594F|nr:hypothetical protein [Pantoea sp. CTOTU46764]